MYERSINEAELILSTQKNSQAPVHKVWQEVLRRSKAEGFEVASLPDFSAMLEGDRRFQLMPAQIKGEEDQEAGADGELDDLEMERLGFYSEDQVKLRTARVVERIESEEEEEIGSIRRKAFVSQSGKANFTAPMKNGSGGQTRTTQKSAGKKAETKKSKAVKWGKPALKKKAASASKRKK